MHTFTQTYTKILDFRSLRPWRIFATGFSFVIFGIGGVIVLIATPFCLLIHNKQQHQYFNCRSMVSSLFRLYITMMKALGLLTYDVRGLENVKKGSILLANHPSLLDVVFLIAFVPRTNCIIKGDLYRNFFTIGPATVCGYLNNDAPELINNCLESLANDSELLVFPQGTRSSNQEKIKFKRGAANIALISHAEIVPVILTCAPETLGKEEAWYMVPAEPPHFSFEFLPSLDIDRLRQSSDPQSLKARKLTRLLEQHFTERLSYTASC